MSGKGQLTSLLTQRKPDPRKIIEYARSKKFEFEDLMDVVVRYSACVKDVGPDINALHVACMRSKPDLVKAIVQEGYDLNVEIGTIDNYLRISLECGNIPVARLLLSLGADPHRMNIDGKTAIEAAMNKNIKEKTCVSNINVLLEAGISINSVAILRTQEKPLHIAVRLNLPLCVSFLLQKGADGNVTTLSGCTPLHFACYQNQVDIIKLLTLHKVQLYIENANNDTPLFILLRSFCKEALRALIEGGCDINMVSCNYTALTYATGECDVLKVRYLVSLGADPNKKCNGGTALHALSSRVRSENAAKEISQVQASIDILEFLVEKGASVNATDNKNNTPLSLALLNKYLKLAKQLIKLGANPNFQYSSKSIFHIISTWNSDIITLALEYGADYNKKNGAGLTPYHCAITSKVNVKFIKSFVHFGCPYNQDVVVWRKCKAQSHDENEQFFKFQEQFFKGILENSLSMVKEAVVNGAVPRGCSVECRYPLHLLAVNGHNTILTYLLENGVPSNTENNKGESVLFVAAKHGHYDVCCTLLQFGACYNYHSKKCSKTPEMIAAEYGHKPIVDLFQSVARKFRLASMEGKSIIKDLMKALSSSYGDYLTYVNAINIKLETLLSTAIRFNHKENAKSLMELRNLASLNVPKSAANCTHKCTTNPV